ncbi:Tc toxin subunit A [Pseudomonas sp. CC120222-01a]|uniref:Tc toxin subunit A n=1 Tax=Pseudomonas sp. CC120222-01a TaxID=1378075 RepID=UPI000D980822|nr:Ig-like domain-containing protein [Pseudomonas sp. CC120222-01a]PVZ39596.1 virulence plasmid A protein [Pseudomonas sp. CC120222-01a]
MAKPKVGKAASLFEKLLDTEPGIKVKLKSTPLADTLLVGLQHLRPTALMAQFPTLTHAQAKLLKARLDVSRAAMMRAFREQRLSDGRRRSADELKGPLAQSTGPTFENQFRPSWGNNADPQAVDATISPAAYLVDLLLFVYACLESEADEDRALSLRARRPDLFELMVDAQTMNQQVTQVELVIHVLQKLIQKQLPAGHDLTQIEDRLLEVRYPPRLFPYEAYWAQTRTVLTHSKVHLSEVSRLSDTQAPYFIRPGAHSARSDDALLQDTAMGPLLRQILLEVPYFEEGPGVHLTKLAAQLQAMHKRSRADDEKPSRQEAFFKQNFGVPGFHNMQNVVNFCQALQIDQAGLKQLFALADHAPRRSDNVSAAATGKWASANLAGARFINSGGADPVGVGSKDGDDAQHEFHFLTAARCDRLNRLVRVAYAYGLTYAQADRLLCAIIDAESRSVIERSRGRLSSVNGPMVITANTLRCLGLFQFLRERFAMADTPERLAQFTEGFSTLLSDMSIYGTSTAASPFDQVFNATGPNALELDDQPFSLAADDSASKRTVDQLCSGLGINMETFRPLSRAIMQAQGGAGLSRSLSVVSAFYRVVWLARLLKITPVELLSLLEVLNPEGLYALQLAGKPQVSMYRNDTTQTDLVNVVHALATCVLWCQEQDIPIAWLVRQLLPLERSDVASTEVRVTLTELGSKLQPFRDFNSLLEDAGVTPLIKGDWQSQLAQIVDGDGLITDSGNPEEDFDPVQYEDFARREIQAVIEQLQPQEDKQARPAKEAELPALTDDQAERLTSLILGVVLRVRSQQWGVVQEQLAQLLELESNMIVPVIYWAESNVHQWMASAVAFDPQPLDSRQLEIILPLERRMRSRAEVVRRFALSPALFSSLLIRVQRHRFSIQTLEMTFATLYYLERYTRLLRMAKQSEKQLLGYFALVEALGEMSDNERRLIKDAAAEKIANWLGCGIREVLDVASLVSADGIIRNLGQLCALLDTRQLCRRTGLSAASLMKLSQLGPGSEVTAYRGAAEEMLSSLQHTVDALKDDEELRQSLSTRCTATSLRLVAKVIGHRLEDQYEEHEKRTTVTLTLLDMNNSPVPDIRVNWSTDLGVLLDHFSYTDEQGRAEVILQSDATQGVANVKARYLLDSEAFAPPIVIDCDDATLQLWASGDKPEEPWLPAGNQGTYTLRYQLRDNLNNLGGDRPVSWSTDLGRLVDSDGSTLTDQEGYSTMRVRSMEAGTGTVLTWYGDRNALQRDIGFANQPFIGTLTLTSPAVAGEPLAVRAWISGLDGKPAANQPLRWECEGAELDKADPQSDENGMANATFKNAVTGPVRVTAFLTIADLDYVSKDLESEVLVDADQHDVTQPWDWPMADGISAAEFAVKICSSKGEPVARYPVTWKVLEDDALSTVQMTGADGFSRFSIKSDEPKTFHVIASWGGNEHEFDAIEFMPALAIEIQFDGEPVHQAVEIIQPLSGASTHTLSFHLQDHPLLGMPVSLRYFGRHSAYSLGLSVEPGFGVEQRFAAGEVAWTVDCESTALIQPGQGEFRLMYEHAVEGVRVPVTVHPPR